MDIKELIEALKQFPQDSTWFGWDDGSIIIEDKAGTKELGFIDTDNGEVFIRKKKNKNVR